MLVKWSYPDKRSPSLYLRHVFLLTSLTIIVWWQTLFHDFVNWEEWHRTRKSNPIRVSIYLSMATKTQQAFYFCSLYLLSMKFLETICARDTTYLHHGMFITAILQITTQTTVNCWEATTKLAVCKTAGYAS